MKRLVYSLSVLVFASGAFIGSATATSEPSVPTPVQERPEPTDEDFIPTEKVPAGNSVSFPVDI